MVSVTMAKETPRNRRWCRPWVGEIFIRHLFTGSSVIKACSGGGERVCTAIARVFQKFPFLIDEFYAWYCIFSAKQLTKPLLKNVFGTEIPKVDAASSHARQNQLVSALTRYCRGFERILRDLLSREITCVLSRIDIEKRFSCEDLRTKMSESKMRYMII